MFSTSTSIPMVGGFDTVESNRQQKSDLITLRNCLKDLQAWPRAGDDLLHLVPDYNWHSSPLTDSDNEWLPLVVRDSLQGIDIGFQYPAFFHKLLTNPRLRRLFLNEIERATTAQ